MKAFLCELILSCVIAGPGAKPIDELTYGTVLYDYYQQDYDRALLGTLVAEAQNRMGEDSVRFELARGSFAFGDNMFAYSKQIFDGVNADELDELDKMRLAFHLSREYYRRQDYARLSTELDRISLGKTWLGRARFHPEVEYMRAELAIENGNFAAAEKALGLLDEDHPLLAYGLFNLGVAYKNNGDLDQARRMFSELSGRRASDEDSEESKDLIERSRLALAFIARAQRDRADAESVLGALPGQGRYRDVAMASYAGLAMENEDYELAARIWLTLQNQAYWTSSTAQARLGFPVSLERLASSESALLQYRNAEHSFENRLTALTSLSTQAKDPAWVHGLLLVFSAPERDEKRMVDLVGRWKEQLGHTDWLEWLAAEATHEVLLEWRELLGMKDWLDELPTRLEAYEEVAAERRRRSAQARTMLYEEELLATRSSLNAQIELQSDLLTSLRDGPPRREIEWMRQIASTDETRLVEDLDALRELGALSESEDEAAHWSRRIDRLEGVFFWALADEQASRTRALEKRLEGNQQTLDDIDERIARVRNAESEFAAGVETDFIVFNDRTQDLNGRVSDELDQREIALANQLRRGMAEEMQEVQQYLLVTRIAIARATDQLAAESETSESAGAD